MKIRRRHRSSEEKVTILRRHLLENMAVSDLCDQYEITPTMFYRWQKEFFDRGASVFQVSNSAQMGLKKQIAFLEAKLTQKNEVLSELMEEHLRLKKTLGVL